MKKLIPLFAIILIALSSCSSDSDYLSLFQEEAKTQINLTFVIPNTKSYTRAEDDYEDGIGSENTINVTSKDYKIYFFSYKDGDEKGGTLLTEFSPSSTTTSSTSSGTKYTVSGTIEKTLLDDNPSFRVVVLANWGSYPTVTEGSTIDDLTEGDNTTFSASSKFQINDNNLIPFYGVQEYTNPSITEGETIKLNPEIGLLRALAKIEVVVSDDSDAEIKSIEIVNYNSEGFSAPDKVYTAKDYSNEDRIYSEDDDWEDVYVKDLHLVGGKNDEGTKSQPFYLQEDEDLQTWRLYVPEYDNSGEDFSYISLKFVGDDTEYKIYFSQYVDGETDNSITDNRFNIKRNNFYRFTVEKHQNSISLSVYVINWTLDDRETIDL